MPTAAPRATRSPSTWAPTSIKVQVTAADGMTTQTYTLTVIRAEAASTDATLSGLTLSDGTLDPAFAAATENYTAEVALNVRTVTVTPTTSHSGASYEITPADADFDDNNGHQVYLAAGDTTGITVEVTRRGRQHHRDLHRPGQPERLRPHRAAGAGGDCRLAADSLGPRRRRQLPPAVRHLDDAQRRIRHHRRLRHPRPERHRRPATPPSETTTRASARSPALRQWTAATTPRQRTPACRSTGWAATRSPTTTTASMTTHVGQLRPQGRKRHVGRHNHRVDGLRQRWVRSVNQPLE